MANNLRPYDLVLTTFITEIRKAFEKRIYGMIALLSGGKGIAVNESAIDFLPHLNSLYIMWSHGISIDTAFKDIAVNREKILILFKHIDQVRDDVYATASREKPAPMEEDQLEKDFDQLLTDLKPLGEA